LSGTSRHSLSTIKFYCAIAIHEMGLGPALSRPKPEEGNEKEGWPARTDLVLRRAGWVHDRVTQARGPRRAGDREAAAVPHLAQSAEELNAGPPTIRTLGRPQSAPSSAPANCLPSRSAAGANGE
jgi:hypothetical protein